MAKRTAKTKASRVEIRGLLDRHAVEAVQLEIRRLARRYGVDVTEIRVERPEEQRSR